MPYHSLFSFLILIIPLILMVFWLWMFKEMADNMNPPPCFISITNAKNPKLDWLFAFVVLSILTAAVYYFYVFRNK